MRAGDPRDLYREQLRFAENILAFLASVSLALLKQEDREKTGIDPQKYWRGGISPGDWKEIIQRCSKVFAEYEDIPLARAVQRLKIGTEQKGFGLDVIWLIRVKNDYKHDRGPNSVEKIARASDGLQERLRRCMEALAFFADYPIRRVEGIDHDGGVFSLKCLRYVGDRPDLQREEVVLHERPCGKGLFLDTGGENWVPLHPFIVPATTSRDKACETCFIDAWDTKKSIVRMKSFEGGVTAADEEVAEALISWSDRF